jgi:hypothetical protein
MCSPRVYINLPVTYFQTQELVKRKLQNGCLRFLTDDRTDDSAEVKYGYWQWWTSERDKTHFHSWERKWRWTEDVCSNVSATRCVRTGIRSTRGPPGNPEPKMCHREELLGLRWTNPPSVSLQRYGKPGISYRSCTTSSFVAVGPYGTGTMMSMLVKVCKSKGKFVPMLN